jgi:hypothetical protein
MVKCQLDIAVCSSSSAVQLVIKERTRSKISNGPRAEEASGGVHTTQTENQSIT